MPVTENLSCWECDCCGGHRQNDQKRYMATGAESAIGWERVRYVFDDGTERNVVLGPDCAREYHEQRKMADSMVSAFFNSYKDTDKKE